MDKKRYKDLVMEDYKEQVIFDDFKEEEFMQNKLIFLDNEINKYKKDKGSSLNRFRLGELALHRIEILETKKKIGQDLYSIIVWN